MAKDNIIKRALLKTFGLPLKKVTILDIIKFILAASGIFAFTTKKEIVEKASLYINLILQRLSINTTSDFGFAQSKLSIEILAILFLTAFLINLFLEIRKADRLFLNASESMKNSLIKRSGFAFKKIDRILTIKNLDGDYEVKETHDIVASGDNLSYIPHFVYFGKPVSINEVPTYEINTHPPNKKPDIEVGWDPKEEPVKIEFRIKFRNPLAKGDAVSYSLKYSIKAGSYLQDMGSILDKIKEGKYEIDEPVELFGLFTVFPADELNLKAVFPQNYPLKSYWEKHYMVFHGFTKNHNQIEEERLQKYLIRNVEPDGVPWIYLHIPEPMLGQKYLLIWSPLPAKGLKHPPV